MAIGYGGYGMGGFGGSVGGSIAQGLQSGFEMGRQVDADRQRTQQQAFEDQRQTDADARVAQASDIANTHQSVLATQALIAGHKARGDQLAQQYPNGVPADVGSAYADEAAGYQATLKGHLQKLAGYANTVRQQAQDDASYMASNKLDPMDPKYPPKRLAQMFVGNLRRPAADLLPGQDGTPAPVAQAADDLETGIKTGNEGLALKAANTLYAPELRTGVGQASPHGGVILGKQIVKILPAPGMMGPPDPNNPQPNDNKVTPILRVFVKDPNADYSHEGGTEQSLYGAPPGATGHYDAPVTENRSTDPNDPVAHVSMDDAINRAHQLKTAAMSLQSNPDLMKKFQQGVQELGDGHDDFLNAYHSMGGTMAPGSKQEDVTKPTLRRTTDAAGNVTEEEITPPAKEAPEKEAKPPPVHNIIFGGKEQSMVWDAKQNKFVPIGVPGERFKPTAAGMGGAMAALSKEQNEALFGEHGAVTEGRLDAGKINSRTAGIFANAEMTHPGMDYAGMSGNIALGRNATFRQRAMTAEVLPEIMKNMVETGKKVGFSDVRTLGKMQAWVKGELNDPDMAEYMSQRNDALMTIAGVMRSTGMSDMAHKAETEVSAPTMSPRALDGWLRGQMKSLEPRLKNMRKITEDKDHSHGAPPPPPAAVPQRQEIPTGGPKQPTVSNW